jgi:predicted Fe-Mo cluster-binding NifX family protein
MKIAVSAERPTGLSSPIDPRFGRARYFVVVDTEAPDPQLIDNEQATAAAHGAGTRAAQAIITADVDAVITGNVGPKALQALSAAGIKVYLTYAGTVGSAVERLQAGRLKQTASPTRTGHT